MRLSYVTLLLCLSSLVVADVQPQYAIHNTIHEKVLFVDSWTGDYVRSFYNSQEDWVRFASCETPKQGQFGVNVKDCLPMQKTPLHYADLDFYQLKLDEGLRQLQSQLAGELNAQFFRRTFGGGSEDLAAIAFIRTQLEQQGLKRWILIRLDPENDPVIEFRSVQTTQLVRQLFKWVISQPAPARRPLKKEPSPLVVEVRPQQRSVPKVDLTVYN